MKQTEDCGKPKIIPKGEDDGFKVKEREGGEREKYACFYPFYVWQNCMHTEWAGVFNGAVGN